MFDLTINRRNTNSAKWDEAITETGTDDTIALSVADMDFRSSPEVINKMVNAANHGIYGYTNISKSYNTIVKDWMKKRYNWEISEQWIVFCPRIIQAISLIIQNNTVNGDNIVIQTPLYSPLKNAIEINNRTVITNPLLYTNGKYEMDFVDLENIFSSGVKAMILCSPHNPVGRVWNEDELSKLIDLCIQYNVLLISDEVHADFTFYKSHIPLGKVSAIESNVIICTSPAKTFNLPGLEVSNIIIPNQSLREKFQTNLKQAGIFNPTYFAVPALEHAYLYGEEWLLDVKNYILKNYNFVKAYIHTHLPKLKVVESEGTYLMWIDCNELGLTESDLEAWFFKKANVAVSMGSSFGSNGKGFIRLNLATPIEKLEEALDRILSFYPSEKYGGTLK